MELFVLDIIYICVGISNNLLCVHTVTDKPNFFIKPKLQYTTIKSRTQNKQSSSYRKKRLEKRRITQNMHVSMVKRRREVKEDGPRLLCCQLDET